MCTILYRYTVRSRERNYRFFIYLFCRVLAAVKKQQQQQKPVIVVISFRVVDPARAPRNRR